MKKQLAKYNLKLKQARVKMITSCKERPRNAQRNSLNTPVITNMHWHVNLDMWGGGQEKICVIGGNHDNH